MSGIIKKILQLRLKIITLFLACTLAVFIISLLICVVTHVTLNDLISSFFSKEIQFAIRMSVVTSIISTFLCVIISVPAAYALARYNFFGSSILNILLDVPLALPPLVAGLSLLIFFGNTSFGKMLSNAGIEFVFSPRGIVLAQFFVNVPFMFRIMKATFQGINPRYEYVAQTLGATDAQAFWRVTLPMAKNGLIAGSIITWCKGIGEFGAALMVAGATRMKTETLPISLYLNISCGDLNLGVAAATILILISLIALFLFERYGGTARVF